MKTILGKLSGQPEDTGYDSKLSCQVKVKIAIPKVPNFISIESNTEKKGMVSIAELDDETLREVGAKWTAQLIARKKQILENNSLLINEFERG